MSNYALRIEKEMRAMRKHPCFRELSLTLENHPRERGEDFVFDDLDVVILEWDFDNDASCHVAFRVMRRVTKIANGDISGKEVEPLSAWLCCPINELDDMVRKLYP